MSATAPLSITDAVRVLQHGGVIAYPTEAVWGLGCDPFDEAAVTRLLALKQRPVDKGLILVAALDGFVAGDTGGLDRPTGIRDARSGAWLRA